MKVTTMFLIASMSVFAISCAHTKKAEPEVAKITQEVTVPEAKETKVAQKDQKDASDIALTCTLGKDTRVLTFQKGDKRCEIHYTKQGQQNQIAWAQKTRSICDNVFNNVISNIEKGGFKCDNRQTTAANN